MNKDIAVKFGVLYELRILHLLPKYGISITGYSSMQGTFMTLDKKN